MTEQDDQPPSGGRIANAFVLLAMGLCVLAVTTALHVQVGVDINVAVASGVLLYAALLVMHALRSRRATGPVQRREDPAFEAFDSVHDRMANAPPAFGADPGFDDAPVPGRAKVAQVALPPLTQHGAGQGGARPPALPPVAPGRKAGARPFEPAQVSELADGDQGAPIGSGDLESDVERIQALVKKLANEISAADDAAAVRGQPRQRPKLRAEAAVTASVGALRETAQGMRAAAASATPPPPPVTNPAGPPVRAQGGHQAAPQVGPQGRQATPPPPPTNRQAAPNPATGPGPAAAPPPLSAAQAKIAAVADSLVAGRVEVELEPIISLIDQRTSHYEIAVNVQGANGERLVENSDFGALHGTGLLPLFDSARLARGVSIAQRLQEKGKKGRVFSAYSIEGLSSPSFLSDARSALQDRAGLGAQLVIGFRQSDVRSFSATEWAAVAELRHLHVVFALDRMSDLDMDLKRLVAAGFAFARVDGAQVVGGLRFGGRPVVGAELVRYVTGAGMTLVGDHIDNEQLLQRVGQAGLQLGQGKLFGGKRPVKLNALKSNAA